jgi:hypothetical protein
MIVALPAVDVLKNCVSPPDAPATVPPLLVIVAVPAVEVFLKSVEPLNAPATVPPLLMIVAVPAVEVFEKLVEPPNAPHLLLSPGARGMFFAEAPKKETPTRGVKTSLLPSPLPSGLSRLVAGEPP